MTRYAKAESSGKKQADDGSSWSSLKKTLDPIVSDKPKVTKGNKKKKQKLTENIETVINDSCGTVSKLENTLSSPHDQDSADVVIKKLKKKRNKQKMVEDAIKAEASNVPFSLNPRPADSRRKQGKGSLKFSQMNADQKKHSRADVHRNRRDTRNPCFVCRSTRHKASNCPKGSDKGVGMCFKCASVDHTSATCPRTDIKDFPHAKCFICNESGHLSNVCPDNPRGLYPNGGCCKECGAVEHFAKDCPSKLKKRRDQNVRLKSMVSATSNVEDNDMMDLHEYIKVKEDKPKLHQPKVVKF